MKGLEAIYIIKDDENRMLFSYELYAQGSEQWDMAFFAGMMAALTGFADEIDHKALEIVRLEKNKLHTIHNVKHGIIFILKVDNTANDRRARNALEKIHDVVIEKCSTYNIDYAEIKSIYNSLFEADFSRILGLKSNLEKFME